ncbi:MAG: chemotaxis protein CheX [Campylobacterota bacterium]|nr:chemotaxis protein CheX [Campylobacterota bacterium]
MRATVSKRIGIFHPQGFIDGNNAPTFLTLDDLHATENLNVDMVLISLKKVIFFNRNGLDIFVKALTGLRSKMHIVVGFCDYDSKKYQAILKFYGNNLNFSLFRTQKIAELFASSNKEGKKTVLLYHEDPSQRSAMAIELFDYGHNAIVAQSQSEFNEKKQNKDAFDVIVDETYLGMIGQKVATRVTGNAIIYTVSNFLDAEITDNFNISYHNNSLNVGFRLFIFDAYKVISMNIHALNFFARLSASAAEYNATICFVGLTFEKTPESFKNDLEDAGIMFFEQMDDILKDKELLAELGASSAAAIKSKRSLNKVIVNELPRFIDATVNTIEMMTNAKATKEAASVQPLTLANKENQVASSIGFYGDLDGMVILVFPQAIAKKTCEILIGEEAEDDEAILDAMAEFVNIIGGRVKALLSEYKISVDITLPRTYQSVDDLFEVVQDKRGVQVDLKFDEDKFIFFLTR